MENPGGGGPKGMDIFWKYTIVYLISDSYLQFIYRDNPPFIADDLKYPD